MAVIDPDHTTINDSAQTTLEDSLSNAKILLYEVDAGILFLIQNKHQSYEFNSGQGSQSVRRLSLEELRKMREDLLYQISELELSLGVRHSVIQVIPGW